MTSFLRPTVAEINLEAIKSNIRQIRQLVGAERKIMPVVKSNAYGHGAVPVARVIEPEVDALGVAYVYEGIELRRGGLRCPILIMSGVLEAHLPAALENDLTLAVGDFSVASMISGVAHQAGVKVKIHVEVDTGMGRLGVSWTEAAREIRRMAELPNIELEGVFSHFATSERKEDAYTYLQIERFQNVLAELEARGVHIPIKHMANSAAILQYPDSWFNLVRPGLMVYGIYPAGHLRDRLSLQFPLTVKTQILQIRLFNHGESISYGRTFICQGPKTIAIIPVGYADGLSRMLSNKAEVLIRDKSAPVVGTICMDACMIDVTHIPDVKIGDEVILVGGTEARAMVERMAGLMGTIPYEIFTSFGRRVRRIYRCEDCQQAQQIVDFG